MNYLQTLDTNLVNDMIGAEVINIRKIKQTRLNYKNLNNEFNSAFKEYCSLFDNGETDKEKIEDLINFDWCEDYQCKAEFWELNSIE